MRVTNPGANARAANRGTHSTARGDQSASPNGCFIVQRIVGSIRIFVGVRQFVISG